MMNLINQKPATASLTLDWAKIFTDKAQSAKEASLKRFYQVGQIAPSTPLNQVPFVAMDFETTGLNPKQDEIISIGLVPFTLERIYCAQSKYWLIKPTKRLKKSSVVIHHITDNDVAQGVKLERVFGEVLEALAGKVVVVHYKKIEREFLNQFALKHFSEEVCFPVVDTLDIEAELEHKKNQGIQSFFNWLKGVKRNSIRLSPSRERYNLPIYQAHHALNDALATAELLQAQIAYHFDPKAPIDSLWQ